MNVSVKRIVRSLFVSLWFMMLVFPVMGIRIQRKVVVLYWERVCLFGVAIFFLSLLWAWYFENHQNNSAQNALSSDTAKKGKNGISEKPLFGILTITIQKIIHKMRTDTTFVYKTLVVFFIGFILLPHVTSMYQTTIFSLAFLYVILALGLNIIVGIAGQLVLGYAAFYAIGAYSYGLLYQFFGLGFWACLPIAGIIAAIAGLLLAFPVLRLRGDYLAIVTLGFGEIVRLLLTNLSTITNGAKGISNIPVPSFFGISLSPMQNTMYVYYVSFCAAIITIIVVARLKDSRVGLALQALKEDEIAGEAMGIDLRKTKIAAFALGSCWAGFAGVLYAARNSYINPASFTFMDSAMILSMVVLGGMGSIGGVVLAALLLSLLPEYLRAFSEYRMLIFGLLMVVMMIFRPQGMIPPGKRKYYPSALQIHDAPAKKEGD